MSADKTDTSPSAAPVQPERNEVDEAGAGSRERSSRRYSRKSDVRYPRSDVTSDPAGGRPEVATDAEPASPAADTGEERQGLKILVVDQDGSRAGYGHDLCNALAERGERIRFVTSRSGRAATASCETRRYETRVGFENGATARRNGSFRGPAASGPLRRLERLRALIRLTPDTRRFDVVHLHAPPDGLLGVLWLRLVGRWTSTALTVHEVVPREGRPPGRPGLRRWTRWVRRLAFGSVDVLFVHSRSTEQALARDCGVPANRIVRIRHGSSSHLMERPSRTPPCPLAGGDTPVVLFMGEIHEYKGVDLLLKAANHLRRDVWNFRVVIAGEPAMEMSGLHDLVRDLGLDGLVEFRTGRIPPEELPAYFSRAAVVALPYRDVDQCPIAVHACTFGKPIVATRVGGLAEMVEEADNGLLVPPGDVPAFASALADVIRDGRLRKRLGSNSLIYAKTDLAWDRIAGESLAAYGSVVARDRRPARRPLR